MPIILVCADSVVPGELAADFAISPLAHCVTNMTFTSRLRNDELIDWATPHRD